jgi:hypothetical protein
VFGHKWEPARGTIVESRVEQVTVAGEPGLHQVRVYVVDVRRPHGQPLRATLPSPYGVSTDPAPGVTVRLEVNAKTGEVRFDPSAPAPAAHAASVREAQGQAGPPGRAGAPAGSVGFSSPDAPGTFEPVTSAPPVTAATFSSPADSFGVPTSTVGPPGGSVSFSSPAVAPAAFEPVTPAGSFGSPGSGSFSAGGTFDTFGQDSESDRIARLEDQRDRGQLTQQQFEVQRQQILDEI